MKLKMHGGTIDSSQAPLCPTCRYSVIVRGINNEQIVRCNELDRDLRFPVMECSVYKHKALPSLWDMNQIAWNLLTDKKGQTIGFKSPGETSRLVSAGKADSPREVD